MASVIAGVIPGTFDAIYRPLRIMLDFKNKSPDVIRAIRDGKEAPAIQNRGQVSGYAVAWNDEHPEEPVDSVAIVYLPRAFDLRDLYVWTSPVETELVAQGLDRIENLFDLADALDAWDRPADDPELAEIYAAVPTAPGKGCLFCPFWNSSLSAPTAYGCPGKAA